MKFRNYFQSATLCRALDDLLNWEVALGSRALHFSKFGSGRRMWQIESLRGALSYPRERNLDREKQAL